MPSPRRFHSPLRCVLMLALFTLTACPDPDEQGAVVDERDLGDASPDASMGEDAGRDDASQDDATVELPDQDRLDFEREDAALPDQDMAGDLGEDMTPRPTEPTFSCAGGQITGEVYADTDLSSRSRFVHGERANDQPLADHPLLLLGADDLVLMGQSCSGGTFGLDGLEDGFYVLGASPTSGRFSASSSQGNRFVEAVSEGGVDVVVFGDSIPKWGPEPWFPDRLEATLDSIVEADVRNVALPGTQTLDWLPDTLSYEDSLKPLLTEADVVIFSLGGNDLYEFATTNLDTSDLGATLTEFDRVIAEVIVNLKQIVTEIRSDNPTADIVWMLYPNYAYSTAWSALAPDAFTLSIVQNLLAQKLSEIRAELAHHEGMLIWDTFALTNPLFIDDYLIDELHLNAAGHELWARELFMMLGGVVIEGGASLDPVSERAIGLGPLP